jgi:hypothetical protein
MKSKPVTMAGQVGHMGQKTKSFQVLERNLKKEMVYKTGFGEGNTDLELKETR